MQDLSTPRATPSDRTPPLAPRAPALDETRRAFLRIASHELRTPLNSVLGFSEIIAGQLHGPVGDQRYAEYAALVRDSGLQMLRLVNQMLEIARLDGGGAEVDLQPEAPLAVLEGAVASVAAEAQARRVTLDLRQDDDAPPVMADARSLRTVLNNVLQAAVAASPAGGVVDVRLRGGARAVLFEVRDRGPGLTRGEVLRLTRASAGPDGLWARDLQGWGAGLGAGLALCVASLACRDMGGVLALRSAPGRGVTVRIRLPAAARADVVRLEAPRPAA